MLEHWFGTPLYFDTLSDIDNKKITAYAKKVSSKNKGRILSNYGGWQSNDFKLDNCENEELLKLANIVHKKMIDFASEIGIKSEMDLRLSNFWLNLNGKGDSNTTHTHPASFFSACYYVQTSKDSGKIEFENPSNFMNYWWQSFTTNNTYTTYSTVSVEPEVGKLVIFPSWLKHYVTPNNSNNLRISVAFNSEIGWA